MCKWIHSVNHFQKWPKTVIVILLKWSATFNPFRPFHNLTEVHFAHSESQVCCAEQCEHLQFNGHINGRISAIAEKVYESLP